MKEICPELDLDWTGAYFYSIGIFVVFQIAKQIYAPYFSYQQTKFAGRSLSLTFHVGTGSKVC